MILGVVPHISPGVYHKPLWDEMMAVTRDIGVLQAALVMVLSLDVLLEMFALRVIRDTDRRDEVSN